MLDAGTLKQCLAILTRLSAGGYRSMRIRNDGTLLLIEEKEGSSDYIAIPAWAEQKIPP